MKKSAKQLIDDLVEAVQNYDTAVGRGGYYASEKKAKYMYARRQLREALAGKWPAKEVIKTCPTCKVFKTSSGLGSTECVGCVRDFGQAYANWRSK